MVDGGNEEGGERREDLITIAIAVDYIVSYRIILYYFELGLDRLLLGVGSRE